MPLLLPVTSCIGEPGARILLCGSHFRLLLAPLCGQHQDAQRSGRGPVRHGSVPADGNGTGEHLRPVPASTRPGPGAPRAVGPRGAPGAGRLGGDLLVVLVPGDGDGAGLGLLVHRNGEGEDASAVVGADAGQVEVNVEGVALAVGVHRHRRRAGSGAEYLLGEPVEFAERVGTHKHGCKPPRQRSWSSVLGAVPAHVYNTPSDYLTRLDLDFIAVHTEVTAVRAHRKPGRRP